MRNTNVTVRAIAVFICLTTLSAFGFPQQAKARIPEDRPALPSKASAALVALPTIDPDGTVHYPHLPFSTATSTISTGRRSADGACHFASSFSGKAGTSVYSSEVSFNPITCVQETMSGELTIEGKASLLESNLKAELSGQMTGRSTLQQIPNPSLQKSTPTSASLVTNTSHTKGRWVDPVYITITSLSVNLQWASDGTSWVWATGYNQPYQFSWDGWTNSGTPPFTPYSSGTNGNSVSSPGSEWFRNVDFEAVLLLTMGFAAYAACGFNTDPAIFEHYREMKGNPDGGWVASANDAKTGGCSNLVHHDDDNGWGYQN